MLRPLLLALLPPFALLGVLAFAALPAGCGPGPEGRFPAPRPGPSAPGRAEPSTRSVCFPGRGDCDGELRNGCEEDLLTSRRHCGLCGKSCRGDCMGGLCAEDADLPPAGAPAASGGPSTADPAVELSLGSYLGCARRASGSVACWGPGAGSPSPVALGALRGSGSIGVGLLPCGVTRAGGLVCQDPETGRSFDEPAIVGALSFAGRGARACVGLHSGKVWCKLDAGGSWSPVPGVEGAVRVAVGERHACALLSGGQVSCWGEGGAGQLGDGKAEDRREPSRVPGLERGVAITAGRNHTCALLAGGEVRCWGENTSGQLGQGAPPSAPGDPCAPGVPSRSRLLSAGADCLSPGLIQALSGKGASQIAAGDAHTCALVAGGAVLCWGDDGGGQLGDGGAARTSFRPLAVGGLPAAVGVASGAMESCALGASGEVFCWGLSSRSPVASGTMLRVSPPRRMALP